MLDIYINPLSANGQCINSQAVGSVVVSLIECFQYLLCELEKERPKIRIFYDDMTAMRSLHTGNNFHADIQSISNRDKRNLWYTYIKNRTSKAKTAPLLSTVTAPGRTEQANGYMREELFFEGAKWLSFGGEPLHEALQLQVSRSDNGQSVCVLNSSNLDMLKRWLPLYEHSPKHTKVARILNGEAISPMPLDKDLAQKVLLGSVEHGNSRYATHSGEYYQFPKTRENIYHGFLVEKTEVPNAIVDIL
jgi:hypothetical protein